MNEAAARRTLLVRSVETHDTERVLLTDDDRHYAARAAAELTRWRAAERGEPAAGAAFIAKRAELLATKLAERAPAVARVAALATWRPWLGVAIPLAGFVLGALLDQATDRKHVNILAFPLFGIVVWNLVVYVLLAIAAVRRATARTPPRLSGFTRRLAGLRAPAAAAAGPSGAAIAAFHTEWLDRSAPLVRARVARVFHLAAALFAAGALTGLYLRGLVFEYRAGWESTFLGPAAVHALLGVFLGPASALAKLPLPSVDELSALRWGAGAVGENAARWMHLYAVTLALAVIVPRLVLAVVARLQEERLARAFPLPLDEPYFRRLLGGWGETPARLRVTPYAYTLDDAAAAGLREAARRAFGEGVVLDVAPSVPFGDEDEMRADAPAREDTIAALVNLAATPEPENHGVFLDKLRAAAPRLVVLVDESSYRQRLGAQAGATERLSERRKSWDAFLQAKGLRGLFVDLAHPDPSVLERALGAHG